MTSSAPVLPPSGEAFQEPKIFCRPEFDQGLGVEAIELAASAGLVLDGWQQLVLVNALGVRPDGKWAAFEVGVEVPRQNGKGGILEARELAGLFLFGERLIQHSAHMFDTSREAFQRLLELVENHDQFRRRVKRVARSHGEEGIELIGGQRIRFRTRGKKGGRGFSGDCLIYDEAMDISETSHGSLLPTLSARPNPQLIYTGSAVDETVHENGVVFARLRQKAIKRSSKSVAYLGWSAGLGDSLQDDPGDVPAELAADPDAWARANPALNIRIDPEYVDNERSSLAARTFAVERLGIGAWPNPNEDADSKIDAEHWKELLDADSLAVDPVVFALDVSPDRRSAAIGSASMRADNIAHIEIVEHRPRTTWVIDRAVELDESHDPVAFILDSRGPASTFIEPLEEKGLLVVTTDSREYAEACAMFFDAVEDLMLRHIGQPELDSAVKGAATRPLGDAWAWSRVKSDIDITPIVSATLAHWGLLTQDQGSIWERRAEKGESLL